LHQVAFVKGLDQKQEQKSGFKKKEKERGACALPNLVIVDPSFCITIIQYMPACYIYIIFLLVHMEFIAACNAFCTYIMIKKNIACKERQRN
jgi:hypothetical protein